MHEGFDINRRNPKSVGSSVTYVWHPRVGACAARLARQALTQINKTVAKSKRFTLLTPGPAGSFARSATQALGIPSLVLETTRIGQPLALRVAQQRLLVTAILRELGVLGDGPVSRYSPERGCDWRLARRRK